MKTAFIGIGIMGVRQAANVAAGGFPLTAYSRSAEKADPLVAKGARRAATIAGACRDADAVITMVSAPADVEEVYFAKGGVLESAKAGALLVDMTTSSPKLAERIHAAAKARGLRAIDAPVTGGEQGAADGTLTIMVGGDKADFDAAQPLLATMGKTIVHFGAAGQGQRAKLVNQVIVSQNVLSAIEGLFFSRKAGLDGETMLATLQTGTADSKALRIQAAKAFRGDFTPGFYPKHLVKDITLAIEEADSLGIDLRGLKNTRARWLELLYKHPEAKAIQDLARLYM
jgi:3-hydroxyisobutyrate dehydrogenase-like beta-hydroxyacid dehydrogenase